MDSTVIRSLAGLLMILGCTPDSDFGRPPEEEVLEGSEWTLTELEGRPPVPGSRIWLEIGDSTLGGYGGCNWYSGSYEISGDGFEVGRVASTARACTAAGVNEQEARLHAALRSVRGHGVRDEILDMTDGSGEVLLRFARREALAMDPTALVGTRWRLQSARSAGGSAEAADTTATLDFVAASDASGFAGCRDYTGTYEARGDRIFFASFRMASRECRGGEAALLREGRFTTDLGESTYWRLAEGQLELTTAGGRTLTFVARR